MKEELNQLIKKYESRVIFLRGLIVEISSLSNLSSSDKSRLKVAEHSQILWREVLKDLKQIVDKEV
mgnify:CR=1 FL=1